MSATCTKLAKRSLEIGKHQTNIKKTNEEAVHNKNKINFALYRITTDRNNQNVPNITEEEIKAPKDTENGKHREMVLSIS